MMRFAAAGPFAGSLAAARKLVEIASEVEPVQEAADRAGQRAVP